ncbi:hypothetical protein [Sandaracinus amylolyticus]|uniref:Uncharacterized protein n=1 Tax=Sandaracinus amylolyticus TaxID=927083 RepID=A0A0F6W293_9BACT|nr:hypothetical protein [Sandaracinus amylolyticus]AKF05415.1 hypothetical protein DB32_002564 [Sandaracinus amylolyticus]
MFEFDSGAVRDAAKAYESIQLQPAQEALVKDLGNLVGPKIGLDPFPCRGFWLMAVRAWQVEHATTADSIGAMPPEKRAAAAREIAKHFRDIVGKQLRDPREQSRLDRVLDDAFAHYLARYNKR